LLPASGTLSREPGSAGDPEWLREHLCLNLCNHLIYLAEWRRLLLTFSHRGIPVILLKGSALSLQSCGDLPLREFTDLDLLVHRGDVFKALRCSGWEGYQLRSPAANGSDADLLRSRGCQPNDVRNFHGIDSASAKAACQHGKIA